MRQSRTIPALLALLALATTARAQDTTLAPWSREILTSANLSEQRTIIVATPGRRKLSELEQAELAGRARPRNP